MRHVPSHGYGFKMGAGLGSIGLFHVVDLAQPYVLFVQRILPCMDMGMALSTDIARDCVQAAFGREGLSKPDQPQTEEFKLVDLMGSRRTSLGVGLVDTLPRCGLDTGAPMALWRSNWAGTPSANHPEEAFSSDIHYDARLKAMLAGRKVLNLDSV